VGMQIVSCPKSSNPGYLGFLLAGTRGGGGGIPLGVYPRPPSVCLSVDSTSFGVFISILGIAGIVLASSIDARYHLSPSLSSKSTFHRPLIRHLVLEFVQLLETSNTDWTAAIIL
jgi:hypothetical protein